MDLRIARTPMTRGVTHLMYVGDDQAVETAVAGPTPRELAVVAVCAVVALQSRGITRLVAGGIAAVIGYRAYRAR